MSTIARAHAHKAEQVRASSKWNARDTRARAQRARAQRCTVFVMIYVFRNSNQKSKKARKKTEKISWNISVVEKMAKSPCFNHEHIYKSNTQKEENVKEGETTWLLAQFLKFSEKSRTSSGQVLSQIEIQENSFWKTTEICIYKMNSAGVVTLRGS